MRHILGPLGQIRHRGRDASGHQARRDGPDMRRGAGAERKTGQGPRPASRTVHGCRVALQGVQGQRGVEGSFAVWGWGLL